MASGLLQQSCCFVCSRQEVIVEGGNDQWVIHNQYKFNHKWSCNSLSLTCIHKKKGKPSSCGLYSSLLVSVLCDAMPEEKRMLQFWNQTFVTFLLFNLFESEKYDAGIG